MKNKKVVWGFCASIIILVGFSIVSSNLFFRAEAQTTYPRPTPVNLYTYCAQQAKIQQSDPALAKLKEELKKSPNFLQYTEYKMLKYKAEKNLKIDPQCSSYSYTYDYDEYSLKPYGNSPLSKELPIADSYFFSSSNLGEGIDLLTGSRAIKESLQLGSIGQNRNTIIPEGKTIPISQVTKLQIKSHPWEALLKGKTADIPEIFSLAPKDYLAFYIKNFDNFADVESLAERENGAMSSLYNTDNLKKYKEQMIQKLGVKDSELARKAISEGLFIWYDFDQRSESALILKLKSDFLDSFASKFISAPADRHGKIGDYYVVASSASLFKYIDQTRNNSSASLKSAGDFKYVLATLEKEYDGLLFISEGFIQKLTSPEYRINSRRRNTTLTSLETLQYFSFAYRAITGRWPSSLSQMEAEGYLKPGTIADMYEYSMDGDGIVRHNAWGSIYDAAGIRSVAIDNVAPSEKTLYDSFRTGYESYWREFIDPVGITILAGDKIKFHTIILPLIDESQYNWLKTVTGGEPKQFDFLLKPDRSSVAQFISKLNVDEIIYEIYKAEGKYGDADYNNCVDDYYKNRSHETGVPSKSISDICKFKEKTRDDAIASSSQIVAKAIDMGDDKKIFDFVGDEFTVFGGESMAFKLNDFSKADINIGIKLNNTEKAKKFMEHLYAYAAKYMGGMGGDSYGSDMFGLGGFFKLDATTPLKNNYNGQDFYIIPIGFVNFYYTFLNDRFYLTISQNALNKLVDDSKKEKTEEGHMKRLIDYIGDKNNAIFIANGSKMEPWIKEYLSSQWLSYTAQQELSSNISYYIEAILLAKTLPGDKNSLQGVEKYYRYIPKNWFDAEMYAKGGEPYLKVAGEEFNALKISLGNSYSYMRSTKTSTSSIPLKNITDKFDVEKALATWKDFEDLGVGLSFTEDGLDIKAAINNPANKNIDSRVPAIQPTSINIDKKVLEYGLYGGGALIVILIIGGIILIVRKRKGNYINQDNLNIIPPRNQFPQNNITQSGQQVRNDYQVPSYPPNVPTEPTQPNSTSNNPPLPPAF